MPSNVAGSQRNGRDQARYTLHSVLRMSTLQVARYCIIQAQVVSNMSKIRMFSGMVQQLGDIIEG